MYSSATANHNQAQFLVCIILVQNNELVTGKIDFVVWGTFLFVINYKNDKTLQFHIFMYTGGTTSLVVYTIDKVN